MKVRRRSLIFRYAIGYALVFCATSLGVLGFLYWSTFALDEGRVDAEIEAEASNLQDRLARSTVSEMKALVTRRSINRPGGSTFYMLATRRREWVAGNLRQWPPTEGDDAVVEFPLGEAEDRARGRSVALPDGHTLLVGRNLGEAAKMRDLILRAMVGGFGLTLIFGTLGGLFLGRRVSSRLDEINQNSHAILGGDLNRRMPVSRSGDEFDELADNLNRMLDRIQSLMQGMRAVSDEIAHDLRSPISRLKSRIEVSLMADSSTEDYREALEETVREADRILKIFNSLIAIALAESGVDRDRFQDVDVSAVIEEAVETYEPLANKLGITLEMVGESNVTVRGEPNLVAQALANLIDNAMKYVPAGGSVSVSVATGHEAVRLVVEDDGPGISASFRPKAFERFSRADESRSTPGSGLGLSLVRAVALLHGGEVELQDAAPGLRVVLHLPR